MTRNEPKTRPELEALLEAAAKRGPLTADEMFEQRVSFVYGQMWDSGLSKDEIRRHLEASR